MVNHVGRYGSKEAEGCSFTSSLKLLLSVCKNRPQRPKFGQFWASKCVKIKVSEEFVKIVSLDYQESYFICSLELLSEMCTIKASKAQFLGYFRPQRKSKFWCLVTFSKSLHWFHISITSHDHCKYF